MSKYITFSNADSAKLVSPRSSTNEKVGGPVKNMGGPIKLFCITMFKIGKSCKKLIFGPVKHEKFSRCLAMHHTVSKLACEMQTVHRQQHSFLRPRNHVMNGCLWKICRPFYVAENIWHQEAIELPNLPNMALWYLTKNHLRLVLIAQEVQPLFWCFQFCLHILFRFSDVQWS